MPNDTPVPATEFKAGNLALDGFAEKDNHWSINPYPAWLEVDLEKVVTLDRIHLYCWWGDDRSYQYTIELSADGKTWNRGVPTLRATRRSFRSRLSAYVLHRPRRGTSG